jgi:hypothetical protein
MNKVTNLDLLKKSLAEYVAVLGKSAAETSWAEDCIAYQSHLAEAAMMLVAIDEAKSIEKLKQLVSSERHGYGWGYLRGSFGSEAESAFDTFARMVETV